MAEQQSSWLEDYVKARIDEAVAPLRNTLEALETRVNEAWDEIENKASDGHYHDEYASQDHVERSENSFNSRFYRLEESVSNLEYKINDVDRKAERAQSTAESAQRNSRGG